MEEIFKIRKKWHGKGLTSQDAHHGPSQVALVWVFGWDLRLE